MGQFSTGSKRRQRRRAPRLNFFTQAIILCTILLMTYYALIVRTHDQHKFAKRSVSKTHRDLPVLLPKNGPYTFFQSGGAAYHETNTSCPVAWEWTTDRTSADVVWFDVLGDYPKSAENVEQERLHPGQLLVFYSLESGMNHNMVYRAKSLGFDFIVDYRIWSANPNGEPDIPAVYLLNPTSPNFPTDFRKPVKLPKRKDALLAAFISNCWMASNNRGVLLSEIMELIPVHSYGSCKNNIQIPKWEDSPYLTANYSITIAGPERYQQKLELASDYYFFLAAENTNEAGYVTEKIYEAMETTAIPVYLGAPDIDRFVPNKSGFINAQDFNSTAALVAHLKSLVENEAAYMKMHEWRLQEFSEDFQRVLRLASRTVHCRLAMKLAGRDFEEDLEDLRVFPAPGQSAWGGRHT